MKRKYFGTDGIRGRVGEIPITPDFVMKLGWAVGKVLTRESAEPKVIIGKDTRISGYMFESALEAGFSGAGVDVQLAGPIPTPAAALLTLTFGADAGIMISASHNSFNDNGLKFFARDGFKLPDELEHEIERQLERPFSIVPSAKLGKASRISDAIGRYIEYCKSTIRGSCSLQGLKIVIDCANGAGYRVAPSVFQELGARVITLANKPDGLNINHNCGSTHPELLRKTVLAKQAHLGIALDGDGDRLIMIDHLGNLVDGDELLFIIAKAHYLRGTLIGGVVGTQMSNMGLELGIRGLGLDFRRSLVGDRYVIEELRKLAWWLGGESSGHIVCLGMTTTGDGIIAALQVLRAMQEQGKTLAELSKEMLKFPQVLINIACANPEEVMNCAAVEQSVHAVQAQLHGSKGRVLVRPSGTESCIRVMVEGEDTLHIANCAEELAAAIRASARVDEDCQATTV